ncbi:pyridoxamine 5'-phosphate oxidase family protein [Aestuariimicrobium ganziense]|uniref:pyridoxamine 5'-phosphate oxidase family protein n=1 Tax=Aestuariimicrobium ganziense TaxID=2773677 RepID=UPI001940D04D|nr:pyridoxamine 5'-phosphate oxidase family protein [Aestuariimicrobium ganziense]
MTQQQQPTPAATASDPDEVAKVHRIMDDQGVAMVTTFDSGTPGRLVSRPLTTQRAEEDGDVLFLVQASSDVVADVQRNPQVNVAYASKKAWVSLSGAASIVEDRAVVERLWNKGAAMFLEGGPENLDNVVLKVTGDTATYWGGESLVGTVVSTIKTVTGKGDQSDAGPVEVDLP